MQRTGFAPWPVRAAKRAAAINCFEGSICCQRVRTAPQARSAVATNPVSAPEENGETERNGGSADRSSSGRLPPGSRLALQRAVDRLVEWESTGHRLWDRVG